MCAADPARWGDLAASSWAIREVESSDSADRPRLIECGAHRPCPHRRSGGRSHGSLGTGESTIAFVPRNFVQAHCAEQSSDVVYGTRSVGHRRFASEVDLAAIHFGVPVVAIADQRAATGCRRRLFPMQTEEARRQ